MIRHWLAGAVLLTLPLAPHVQANPQSPPANDSLVLWLGASTLDFGYKEHLRGGELFNREDGILFGGRLGLEYYWDNKRFSLDLSHHDGVVDYDGQTQAGMPLTTLTDETITHLSLTMGHEAETANGATAYWGLGYRHWRRNIRAKGNVLGLLETYMWPYVMLGLRSGVWGGDRSQLLLDGRLVYPVAPKMRVETTVFDTTTLNLNGTPGLRLALPWRMHWQRLRVELEPAVELWRITRSAAKEVTINGTPTGYVIYEPASSTLQPSVTLSVGF